MKGIFLNFNLMPMKKFICCVAALSALIFSSGCGNDEKKVEPVDEYWIEWKNESDYRIDSFM